MDDRAGPSQKGAAAEAKIAAAAIRLRLQVLRPVGEGGRYDLARRSTYNLGDTMIWLGAIAQLGERRHGMAEVEGSSPSSSIGKHLQLVQPLERGWIDRQLQTADTPKQGHHLVRD
jgi:hypothetical protein